MANTLAPVNSLTVIRGASKTLELTVKDPDDSPIDLTGSRVVFTAKASITDTLPLIQKDSDKGITEVEIINPTAGLARIYLSYLDTGSLDPGLYEFDVWVHLASGKRYPVIGPCELEVHPAVTILA